MSLCLQDVETFSPASVSSSRSEADATSEHQESGDEADDAMPQQQEPAQHHVTSSEGSDTSEDEALAGDVVDNREINKKKYREIVTNNLNVKEIILTGLAFCLRYNLPYEAMEDLFEMFSFILNTSKLPTSKYLIKKVFDCSKTLKVHFLCDTCSSIVYSCPLSEKTDRNRHHNCNKCDEQISLKDATFFITLSIATQLKKILNNSILGHHMVNRETPVSVDGVYRHFYDGTAYKDLNQKFNLNSKDITLSVNYDGAPVTMSSKTKIVPILCSVNEFPAANRQNDLLVAAIWCGDKEPDPQVLFQPTVSELSQLGEQGFRWSHSGSEYRSRVFPLCFCVDSKARGPLINMIEFSGYYGCPWCYHPGVLVTSETNPLGNVRYCTDEEYNLRTNTEIRADMAKASRDKNIIVGVKGFSCLAPLISFNFCKSIRPHYMHNVPLGVDRTYMANLLEEGTNPYYLNAGLLNTIDRRLTKLAVPRCIQRTPRPMSLTKYWKASEWKHFLLFYSLPVLADIVHPDIFQHLALLTSAMFILLSDRITTESLERARSMLNKFVLDYERLFGRNSMVFNVHQLMHLADNVEFWGPLFTHCCFIFESFIGVLLNQIHGTKGVAHQIMNRIEIRESVHQLLRDPEVSENEKTFVHDINHYKLLKNARLVSEKFYVFGSVRGDDLQNIHTEFPQLEECYSNMLCKPEQYHGSIHETALRRNDSFVIIDESVFEVFCFGCAENGELYAVGSTWHTAIGFPGVYHLKRLMNKTEGRQIRHLTVAPEKLLWLSPTNNDSYVTRFPNRFERE